MKYKMSDDLGSCCFELWDGKLVCCNKPTYILAGKKYVCKEHLQYAVQGDRNPKLFNLEGKEVLSLKHFNEIADNFAPRPKVKEVGVC